jgi:hypothetical protein
MDEVNNEVVNNEVGQEVELKVDMKIVSDVIDMVSDKHGDKQPIVTAIALRALSDAICKDLGIDLSDGEWSVSAEDYDEDLEPLSEQ